MTEKICYILMFSIFLPFFVTAAVLAVVFIYLLTKKEYRTILFRADGRKWLIVLLIPLFLSPLMRGYWLGFAAGIGVTALMLIGIWLGGVMNRRIFDNCLNIAVFMSIPAALYAYLEKIVADLFQLGGTLLYRSASFFMNPNYYGMIIEFVCLICLYKWVTDPKPNRRLYYATALGMNLIAMYLCNSFSALAALGIATLVWLICNRKFKMVAAAVGVALVALLIILLFPSVMPRFADLDSSYSIRAHIWEQSFSAFLQHPVFGIGTLGYWEVSAFESYTLLHQPHSHNVFLDVLLNYGLFGCTAGIGYIIRQYGIHFKAALRSAYRPVGMLVVSVAVAILIHGMTDVTLLFHQTGLLMLFLVSGLSLVANEESAASRERFRVKMQKGLDDLEDAVTLRQQVFVIEQGFMEEFDQIDAIAWHVVLYDDDQPIATGRVYLDGDRFHIGRVAVSKPYRRLRAGSVVVEKLEEKIAELGGTESYLSSQLQARGFYEKLGYRAETDRSYLDQHCLHIDMIKSLVH